jgi:hypothetical protein
MGMLTWLMIRDGEVGQDGDMEGDMEMRRSSDPIAEARASDHDESALEARAGSLQAIAAQKRLVAVGMLALGSMEMNGVVMLPDGAGGRRVA